MSEEEYVRVLIQTRNGGQITSVAGDRPIDHFVYDADEHTPHDIPEDFRPLAIQVGAVNAGDYADDYAEFESRYTPVPNPASGAEHPPASCFYGTAGEELERVLEVHSATPRRVWTLVDGGDGKQYIVAGLQTANRINYLITNEEWQEEGEIYGNFLYGDDADGGDAP